MKKIFLLGIVLIAAALVFFGCKDVADLVAEYVPSSVNSWMEVMKEIDLTSGDNGFSYTFAATSPPAEKYTLYYCEGIQENSNNIILNGAPAEVNRSLRKGSIHNLKKETTYSVIVVAEYKNLEASISPIARVSIGYSSWAKALDDLEISIGKFGELDYTFSETVPFADKYTLYYASGENYNQDNANELVNFASVEVTPSNTLKKIDASFSANTTYNFIVVAEYNGISDKLFSNFQSIHTEFNWDKGLHDFFIDIGESHTELSYSFTETVPPAHSYILYYIEGEYHEADDILGHNDVKQIEVNSSSFNGTISDLLYKQQHSFVLVAKHDDLKDHVSHVIRHAPKYPAWHHGIEDFTISKGDFGEFSYSFAGTSPAADTYTLYYYGSSTDDVSTIISKGTSVKIDEKLSGTVKGLKGQVDYSIVIVAEHTDLKDTFSSVEDIRFDWESSAKFEASPGDTEIIYSFAETKPAADKYTLYYYKGRSSDPSVIKTGDSKVVEPVSSGKISDGLEEILYSVMLVAEFEGLAPLYSEIKTVNLFKGQINLIVTAGVNTNGELTYKFNDSTPPADSYTMYYLQGTTNDAEIVISTGIKAGEVTPTQDGIISGKKIGGQYRIVIVAESPLFGEVASSVASANIAWVTTAAQLNTNFVHSYVAAEAVMNYSFDHTTPVADSYWI